MAERPLIIEMAYQPALAEAAFDAAVGGPAAVDMAAVPKLTGVALDTEFAPTQVPGERPRTPSESDPFDLSALFEVADEPEESTYVVRAWVDEAKLETTADRLRKRAEVVGVYADTPIEPSIICPGAAALGTHLDVERLLCASRLRSIGADGSGVVVAVVDTGVNMAHLNARGKTPTFDASRSWAYTTGLTPGSMPTGHGTMCAFDVCIAAPRCTLLDIALLRPLAPTPTGLGGLLSDAVRAYNHLLNLCQGAVRIGRPMSLVVNNSWGMFHPSWDLPPGDPGNYSDNPNHPFNRIVGSLERAGADILFAAGNCGPDCPDGRCQGVTANAIYGANGHPSVLCVAGVDTSKTRVGYSTVGPGRLTRAKPDISGYTHFQGSGVYPADGGTSAATPVVAGVVAAVRSKRPFNPPDSGTHPAAIRSLVTSTAEDLGPSGYDFQHGHGVVDGCALANRLGPRVIPPKILELCRRYPQLCRPRPDVPIDICRRFPWICKGLPERDFPPIPDRGPLREPIGPRLGFEADLAGDAGEAGDDDPVIGSYLAGYYDGLAAAGAAERPEHVPAKAGKERCGCTE